VAASAGQIDELRRAGQISGQVFELLARHDRVTLCRDENGRCSNGARIHAVQIARQRQRQKACRRPSIREPESVVTEVALHREAGVVLSELGRRSVESVRELAAAAVCGNGQFAGDGHRVARPIRGKPEANDAALDTAERGAHRMRLVRCADGDDAIEAVRVSPGEGESDHSAVGRTDERVETRDAEQIEDARDRVGLVGRAHSAFGLTVIAPAAVEEIDAEHAERVRVDRTARADDAVPPSWRRVVLARRHMARRRYPAEHRDDRRGCRANHLERRKRAIDARRVGS
jgi:hypothetical protein